MAYRIRHRRQHALDNLKELRRLTHMIHDADKLDARPADPPFEQITMTFLCPPGFEPAAFLITALDKEGRSFTNAPTDQPALALRLATVALDFASQHAIVHIQAEKMKASPIVQVPAGAMPPTWRGPEGRG